MGNHLVGDEPEYTGLGSMFEIEQLQFQAVVSNIQVAQRLVNICNSLTVICLHHNLLVLANHFAKRATKAELALAEVPPRFQSALYAWKGRLLLSNVTAFLNLQTQKDLNLALESIQESQRIASKFLTKIQEKVQAHAKNKLPIVHDPFRDLDYMVQTNLLSFIILWRAQRYA